MIIISLLLCLALSYLTWKDNGCLSYAKIFIALILAFHYAPLFYMQSNYDVLPIGYSLAEIISGILEVTNVCLFTTCGVLVSKYIFRYSKRKLLVPIKPPRITLWFGVNFVTGSLICLNNIIASHRALSSGYLDIYASSSTFIGIKTITILPVYTFSLFYLILAINNPSFVLPKKSVYSVFIILFLLLVSCIFTGSRSTAIYFVLSLLAIWSAKHKVKMWKYLPHAVCLVVLSVIIGVLREGGISGISFSGLFLRPIFELANTAIVLLNCDSITNEFNFSGTRYLSGLLYIFPVSFLQSLGIDPPTLLSQQYVNIVDPGWADMGGGFGFSLVAEMYLLGGQWGVFLLALFIGGLLGWIDFSLKSSSVPKAALAASVGFFMLFAVRGEVIELYRNFAVVFSLYLFTIVRITTNSLRTLPAFIPDSANISKEHSP